MTPTERGRFCAACQKQVNDYTQMNNRELVNALKTGPSSCGRFCNDQLDRYFYEQEKTRSGWLSVVMASALAMLSGQSAEGRSMDRPASHRQQQHLVAQALEHTANGTTQFYGQVRDAQTGEPIAGAIVYCIDANVHVETDANGCFALTVTMPMPSSGFRLRASALSYGTHEMVKYNEDHHLSFALEPAGCATIEAEPALVETGGMVVVTVGRQMLVPLQEPVEIPKPSVWKRIGNWFRRNL